MAVEAVQTSEPMGAREGATVFVFVFLEVNRISKRARVDYHEADLAKLEALTDDDVVPALVPNGVYVTLEVTGFDFLAALRGINAPSQYSLGRRLVQYGVALGKLKPATIIDIASGAA